MKTGILAWGVRHALQRDFTGTLRTLAEQGWDGIHFLGDFGGYTASQLPAVVEDSGLEACAIHGRPEELLDASSRVYDYASALKCTYLTTSLSKPDFGVRYREYADTCNRIAKVASDNGFCFAYHNHGVEFAEAESGVAYDRFCSCLDEHVTLNLNVLWATMVGANPMDCLEKYLDRSPIVHIGDCEGEGEFRDLGGGVIPLETVMPQVEGHAAWVILDHSNDAGAELPSAARCIHYLRSLVDHSEETPP